MPLIVQVREGADRPRRPGRGASVGKTEWAGGLDEKCHPTSPFPNFFVVLVGGALEASASWVGLRHPDVGGRDAYLADGLTGRCDLLPLYPCYDSCTISPNPNTYIYLYVGR